jgi:hypothetical protein
MWPFSQWTTAGRAALIYITVGALTVIWTGVWYGYLINNPPVESAYYWCTGFLVTGLTMLFIGSGMAMISRSTRHADLIAAGAPMAVVNLQPNVATVPAAVLAPLNVTSPAVASNGQVVLAPPKTLSVG